MVSESYVLGYDIWANLLSASVTKCSAPMLSVGVTMQNKINNTGFSYDAAGNSGFGSPVDSTGVRTPDLTGDGSLSYTWDAESRMKSAAGVNYTGVYPERSRGDGDDRRVQKSNGKLYWYGAGGDPIAESDASGNLTSEYIFFGGKRIARVQLPGGPSRSVHVQETLVRRGAQGPSPVLGGPSRAHAFRGGGVS